MLHKNFSSINSSTPRKPISKQLPLPGMATPETIRIRSKWLPAGFASTLAARPILLRLDTFEAAYEIVMRGWDIPRKKNGRVDLNPLVRLVVATALSMESGVFHG